VVKLTINKKDNFDFENDFLDVKGDIEGKLIDAKSFYEEGDYRQSWDYYNEIYTLKYPGSAISTEEYYKFKGEAAYGMCKIMQMIPFNDELIDYLMEHDKELKMKSKMKNIKGETAKKIVGRRCLKYAADDCGYIPAIIEYALNCVGHGHKKSFVFEYNDQDAQVGLQWANKLINQGEPHPKSIGYSVYAKYHFARYTKTKSLEDARLFCENVLNAKNCDEDDQYVLYFYAHMCTNPNFQKYENGKYADTKKGYELFGRVIEIADDPDLIYSAKKIKVTLETKYPDKIK